MSAQDVIMGARVARVRELKGEIERLKADNAALRGERDSLRAHLGLAMLAAMDLRDGGRLEIWDGWNLVLGAERAARDRAGLIAQAKAAGRRIWIVFDGPDENVRQEGLVRISYTGGTGAHRADRFIVDFVRMAGYLGLAGQVSVRTHDKDFLSQVRRLGAVPAEKMV
ncbi:MAG: hypothetical protein ACI4RD_07530 [Kiritimatiellia bacterium]